MTPIEFKAWFEGFIEGIEGRPNERQWDKIKKRVEEIDGKTITERVYVDRYYSYPYYSYPYCYQWTNTPTLSNAAGSECGYTVGNGGSNMNYLNCSDSGGKFDSISAMYSLGKSESTLY